MCHSSSMYISNPGKLTTIPSCMRMVTVVKSLCVHVCVFTLEAMLIYSAKNMHRWTANKLLHSENSSLAIAHTRGCMAGMATPTVHIYSHTQRVSTLSLINECHSNKRKLF